MNRVHFAEQYIGNLCYVLYSSSPYALGLVLEVFERALLEQRQVFLAGNGGSAATASHMAEGLVIASGVRAVSLSDNTPSITAVANDDDYSEIFASQLKTMGRPEDVLVVFSGSGDSPNIIRAIEVAKQMQITTVGFLGMGGGQAAGLVDVFVIVPSDEYGPIEDAHMAFSHLVTDWLQRA